jgi:hypothetical protein
MKTIKGHTNSRWIEGTKRNKEVKRYIADGWEYKFTSFDPETKKYITLVEKQR